MDGAWITDLQHVLDKDGSIAPPSGSARRLAEHLTAIVTMVSRPELVLGDIDRVRCRRRPQRKPCPGQIDGELDVETSEIMWWCPVCGDHGSIRNWEGTQWDCRIVPDSVVERLANYVLDCHAEFDERLERRRYFPLKEFDRLWEAAAAIGDRELIHRAVASEISGLREYLELEIFRTPGEILARADRMECILFTGHDPYFEGDEPPGL